MRPFFRASADLLLGDAIAKADVHAKIVVIIINIWQVSL